MEYKFNGVLVYNDNVEYEIHSLDVEVLHNLSDVFNKVYESLNQKIDIKAYKIGNFGERFEIFNVSGVIYKAINKKMSFSWHVNGVCIEKLLFDNVGERVEILINTD